MGSYKEKTFKDNKTKTVKMKIGILTLPLHTNYGGILQAYALYSTLQNLGHEVSLIDGKMYEITSLREKLSVVAWQMLKSLGFYKKRHPQLELRDKMEVLIPFIQKYIPQQISLQRVHSDTFDAIVVGSDQVWRGLYCDQLLYFLDFAKDWNVQRVAYAASFGVDDWRPSLDIVDKCKSLLSKFTYVSTREKSGIKICRDILDCNAEWVIDPTMLLTPQIYKNLAHMGEHEERKAKNYLLAYLLDSDKEKKQIVEKLASKHNLSIVNIGISETGQKVMSIGKWLRLIDNSGYVVTDSFHGTVFSILFNRPFCVLQNSERGNSRFNSLLEFTGLTARMSNNPTGEIDWQTVNSKINTERKRCIAVLKNILK